MNFKVTLLGTGGSAGLPHIGGVDGSGDWGDCDPGEPRNRRLRASIVIETADGKRILVDTGPDLRAQLIACKIPRIDALIYTHSHADHIAGLDEVRILNRILGAPLPCYTDEKTWNELRRHFDYAFRHWDGNGFFRPVFDAHAIEAGQTIEIAGLTVSFIGQDHGYTTSLGLRVQKFAYCTDVVRLDEMALAALQGLDTLVVDCFTRGAPHPTHANLPQIYDWVARLKPKRTILTHLGPSMDYRWLYDNLPARIQPGFDGLVIDI